MSISEQVKELKKYCVELEKYGGNFNNRLSEEIRNAIDTIEALSAKLSVENMERSEAYDGGGSIACEDRLPKENHFYNVTILKAKIIGLSQLIMQRLVIGGRET